jgi:hypothetical protein
MVAVSSRKDDYLFIRWSHEVKRLGHFSCAICGKRGELNAHHLNGWNWAIEERYDIANGVCLCKSCHDDFHFRHGKGNNTKEQFEEYVSIFEVFVSVAKKQKFIETESKKLIQKISSDEVVEEILKQLAIEESNIDNDNRS